MPTGPDPATIPNQRCGAVGSLTGSHEEAVTNWLDIADHELVQESAGNRYPVTTSLAVAAGRSSAEALGTGTVRLHDAGSAQDQHRREILCSRIIAIQFRGPDDVRRRE